MSELRDAIKRQVNRAGSFENGVEHYVDQDEVTDEILRLVAERLTSDEAVEAACSAMYLLNSDDDWTAGERGCTRDGLDAALAAAGIVKGKGA